MVCYRSSLLFFYAELILENMLFYFKHNFLFMIHNIIHTHRYAIKCVQDTGFLEYEILDSNLYYSVTVFASLLACVDLEKP